MPHAPPVLLEQRAVFGRVTGERQLERLIGPGGELEELQKLVVLAPGVALALEGDLARAATSCRWS
jgi:hypothetical protein